MLIDGILLNLLYVLKTLYFTRIFFDINGHAFDLILDTLQSVVDGLWVGVGIHFNFLNLAFVHVELLIAIFQLFL